MSAPRSRKRRWLRRAAIGFALVVGAAATPIAAVETACRAPEASASVEPAGSSLAGLPGYARPEARSYLSYPEWYIVHAYEDFAAVLDHQDEHAFDYVDSIVGFWTSLCGVNRIADATGESHADMKVMLYTIGLSFSGEMAVKGAYESTVGRLTAWLRGPEATAEDLFARAVARGYAAFLHQTPWYEYPFGATVARFWTDTPASGPGMLRKVEPRAALTLEWGAKAAYAYVIRHASAAALGTADLTIGSVVSGLDPATLESDPRIAVVRELDDGRVLIETPRYRAYTRILHDLASRGGEIVEIAGNDDVLVTALLPAGTGIDVAGTREIFSVPLQARPGWHRAGLHVEVAHLATLIRALPNQGAELEHVYDY